MIQRIRSTIFLIGYLIIGLIITPIMLIPSLILPYRLFRKIVVLWSNLILSWAKISVGIRYKIIGKENIAQLNQHPHVVISNHQSAFETLLLSKILPDHSFILKKELLYIPFIGWGLMKAKQIAINRKEKKKALQNILQSSKKAFKENRSIVIFPEGTRVKPNEYKNYQNGAFVIATKLKAPILPISHNSGLAWPKNSFIKNPGTITITIGRPIESDRLTIKELKEKTEEWINSHIKADLTP